MKLVSMAIACLCFVNTFAQNREEDTIKTKNFPQVKEIQNTNIPGAPILSDPIRLTGRKNEIRTEKHGLIYPTFFDWNRDGKKDLLLGEFETGETGSNIKVYLNKGSDKKPKYTGEYFYATDVNGDTISNHQWCCIGIHPRIVDLDGDGFQDIVSGQYNPGKISWWRGSEKGFLPRVFIEQEGYVEGARLSLDSAPWDPKSNSYWNYTSVDFADFNQDGLLDLFVGGSDGFRVALNVGTKAKPKFGLRKYLHHVDGSILHVMKPSQEEITRYEKRGIYANMSGVGKAYMTPTDWDGDGVLDLLVTHEYSKKGHHAIEFFRGVETDQALRFEKRKALFTAKDGTKVMPGCQPMITVVDYNNDGIRDIVMGISIPTVNSYEADSKVAWSWVKDLQIQMPGKDCGRSLKWYGGLDSLKMKIKEEPWRKKHALGNLEDLKYLTMRHRGYVFVFYGKENNKKSIAQKIKAQPAVQRELIKNEQAKSSKADGPVQFTVKSPERVAPGKEFEVIVDFKLRDGWYLYSNNKANIEAGFIPTLVDVEFSDGVETVGEIKTPKETPKGGMIVYKGKQVSFTQKFKLKTPTREDYENGKSYPMKVNVKVKIKFQTCNNEMCLPPEEHQVELIANLQ